VKNKEKKDVKINVKKSMLSVLFLIFVVLSSSYLFQSCNSSIIDENNIDQIIDDLSKIDEDDSEIEYFIIDVANKLNTDLFILDINNEENANIPNTLRFIEFNYDRLFGWVTLEGFEQNINNGLYYFELIDNSIMISNDDYSFIGNLNFNNCWLEEDMQYINFIINDVAYKSQIL